MIHRSRDRTAHTNNANEVLGVCDANRETVTNWRGMVAMLSTDEGFRFREANGN